CLRHERPDWLRPGPVPQCGWPLRGQEHINSSCWGTWSQTRGETSLPPLLPRPEWAHPRSSAPRTVPEELRPRSSFRSCLASPPEARRRRKRVVFADTKGPSLTSVHRFEDAVGGDSEEDSCRGSSCARPEQPSSPEPSL
ncbi:hypothetical protein EI555_010666, partial [Monodon monoceros]